jgi:hypothetical protein
MAMGAQARHYYKEDEYLTLESINCTVSLREVYAQVDWEEA